MNRLLSIGLLGLALVLSGCAQRGSAPVTGQAFALFGDVPYSRAEVNHLDGMIDAMNREPLAFVVHVGDITSGGGPCTDAWLEARREQFARLRAPFILLPGDNDWTDCHRTGFDPMERLRKWRSLFCREPATLEVERIERQPGEYCEHLRWIHEGVLFVALNLQGSNNNFGRTPDMDREVATRMRAVHAWIDASAQQVRDGRARALVLLMQADPFFERGDADNPKDGLAVLRRELTALAASLGNRLAVVHGDTHVFRNDRPRAGLQRVEVPGSPFLRWLRTALPAENSADQNFLTVEIVN